MITNNLAQYLGAAARRTLDRGVEWIGVEDGQVLKRERLTTNARERAVSWFGVLSGSRRAWEILSS